MHSQVTTIAKCDQVFFAVISRVASKLDVMELQALHASTALTAPAIAFQNLAAKFAILNRH
jgi:hypothetical protein